MWVRLPEWMIYDDAPPMPEVGSVLPHVGLRVSGQVEPAQPGSPDEIVEARPGHPSEITYRLTGRAGKPRDVYVGDAGPGRRHWGAEFSLTIKSDRYQAQTGSWARDITDGSRVTVTGRLWVIADYEWDAFPIDESRADWLVKAVARAGDGDAMIDLDLSEAATGG